MCTVVILRRPGHSWPVLIAANRDEMVHRPWRPPARHWPDRPEVRAGLDIEAGGSWMGLNDHGVAAGVLNRPGALGPLPGMRSRGELVLEALDHADAAEAARALAAIDPEAYRPFNMLVADNAGAWWLRSLGPGALGVEVFDVPPGLHMLTAHDLDDEAGSARIAHYLPLFRRTPAPDPGGGDWAAWERLMASRLHPADSGPDQAMAIVSDRGFGTVSSSLLALPAACGTGVRPVWLHAPGRPGETAYEPVPD